MRQIGDDLRVDPFKEVGVSLLPDADLKGDSLRMFNTFVGATMNDASHKFCAKLTIDLSSSKSAEAEVANFRSCVDKYESAFRIFRQERDLFNRKLDEID